MKACKILIDSIISDSTSLRTKMLTSSTSAKTLEDLNFSLLELTQVLEDLIRGSSFYDNLCVYLKGLDQTVDDYIFARQAQFADLLKIIENSKPRGPPPQQPPKNESFVSKKIVEEKKVEEKEPELFFNEEKNQFPLGSSVFMPAKKGSSYQSGVNVLESTVVTHLGESKKKY